MKTSIVASVSQTGFAAVAFQEDFVESIKRISSLGFDGVELALRDPRLVEVEALKRLLGGLGLSASAIGTGQAYIEEGLDFTASSREIRERAVERIKRQIDLASQLDALVILGLIRGLLPADGFAEAGKRARDAFCTCGEYAKECGVTLVVEPINRYETNFLNTVDEALSFIEELGCPNLSLLLDTFHMNIEEVSITKSIQRAGHRISHVHLADSNRWAPGFGHIDFEEVLETLSGIGYSGFISAEILPRPDAGAAASQAAKEMKRLLDELKT